MTIFLWVVNQYFSKMIRLIYDTSVANDNAWSNWLANGVGAGRDKAVSKAKREILSLLLRAVDDYTSTGEIEAHKKRLLDTQDELLKKALVDPLFKKELKELQDKLAQKEIAERRDKDHYENLNAILTLYYNLGIKAAKLGNVNNGGNFEPELDKVKKLLERFYRRFSEASCLDVEKNEDCFHVFSLNAMIYLSRKVFRTVYQSNKIIDAELQNKKESLLIRNLGDCRNQLKQTEQDDLARRTVVSLFVSKILSEDQALVKGTQRRVKIPLELTFFGGVAFAIPVIGASSGSLKKHMEIVVESIGELTSTLHTEPS